MSWRNNATRQTSALRRIIRGLDNNLNDQAMSTEFERARAARLASLRSAMARAGIDAYVLPSSDPHLSEYLPGHWKGREWLSGFTGSVGTFIATAGFAGVWTDGRYFTQAETELAGSEIALMKIPGAASQLHVDWLSAKLAPDGIFISSMALPASSVSAWVQ